MCARLDGHPLALDVPNVSSIFIFQSLVETVNRFNVYLFILPESYKYTIINAVI